MKKNLLFLFLLLIFNGCGNKNLSTPNLDTLKDVTLDINNNNILLKKEFKVEEVNEKESKKKSILTTENQYYTIEKIPDFESKYFNSLDVNRTNSVKKIEINKGKVKVSVENIPISEFIDLIFSSVLKENYTVNEKIKQLKAKVSLNMPQEQPTQEVFSVVKKILLMNGVKVTKENGLFFLDIEKSSVKSTEDFYISYGRSLSNNIPDEKEVFLFIPYYYISGGDAVNFYRKLGFSKLKFFYNIKGIQMVQGKANVIRKLLDVINLIDRPYLTGTTPYLLELQNIEASKFRTRLNQLLEINGIKIISQPSHGGILINEIPELNSLLIVSPKQSWIDMILYWKEKLDIIAEIEQEPHFYSYKVQNRKADELAKVLNSVIELKISGQTNQSNTKVKTKTKKKTSDTSKKTNIKIVADLPTNNLMMQMLPSEYRELLPLIQKLDAIPLQVLAELTIAEVTLTDSFSLGFEHTIKNNRALQKTPFENITNFASGTLSGSGFAATYQTKNINTIINTFAKKELLNIISKPKMLILNNETGNINVGSQVPILTSSISSEDSTATKTTVNYKSTGITVTLQPTINSNGILTLNVNLNLSEAQLNETSTINSPLIVNRSVKTTLTIKNNETILLGGLISKNESESNGGVPILMDLPFIGKLFQSESKRLTKTELIMLIRPVIITSPEVISKETIKFQSVLKLLDKYSLI